MSPMKQVLASLGAVALTAIVALGAAPVSAEPKCEPEMLATKYPSLADKTIVIAQDGQSPPFSFRDPDDFEKITGIDAELAGAVFECAGVPYEIMTGAWSGLLPAVIAGQADVMWDVLYYTPERAEKVDFVTYLTAATGAAVPLGNPNGVKSIEDVCGLKAAAGLGTVEEAGFRDMSEKCVAEGKPAIEVVTYPDLPGGVRLLKNGRADVLMSGYTVVSQIVADNPDDFELGYIIVTDYKIAAAVTKGNTDLAQMIYDGLTVTMADGTYDALLEKYGFDKSLARTPEILTE